MKTKNAMQLKAKINAKAKELRISSQLMMQNYLMECFLSRLSKTEYSDRFILKGGILIASIVGLSNRSTMDIDTTIKNTALNENEILKILNYVCSEENDDNFVFSVDRVEPIKKDDEYQGLRAFLFADFEQIRGTFSIDITAGDSIYPQAEKHSFEKIFDGENFELFSYPIETVLAEKIETILARNITTTRPRDFYDVYILSSKNFNPENLKIALLKTCEHRKSMEILSQIPKTLALIKTSDNLKQQWKNYSKKMPYTKDITFEETVGKLQSLLVKISFLN